MQTRSSVLGKRHAPVDATSSPPSTPSSSSSLNKDVSDILPTPDTTPNPKRIRLSGTILDGDNNKENIPPLRIDPIRSSPSRGRSLRRHSTEQLSSPASRTPSRRHASFSVLPPVTPVSAIAHRNLATPPPTPPSALQPLHGRVRTLLRATCNGNLAIAGRQHERKTIIDFISSLAQDISSTGSDAPVLYISGTPGTGKTALVNSILGEMREMLEDSATFVLTVNCMALDTIEALLELLLRELCPMTKSPRKGRTVKDSLVDSLQAAFANTSRKCLLLLDELDHIASSSSSLTTFFSIVHKHAANMRVIGIANTHTLSASSSATSVSAMTMDGVQTLHFAPYTPQQLMGIIQTRLSPLHDAKEALQKFLPTPALILLTKKVAAMTGDVRVVFEVLRGAIDTAIKSCADATTKVGDHSDGGNPLHVPAPIVSPAHVLTALKAYAPASTCTRAVNSSSPSQAATSQKASDSEVVAKVQELGLQARIALLSILLARLRVNTGLSLTNSSSNCASVPRTPSKKRPQGTAALLASGLDVSALYTYYCAVLSRSENGVFSPVSRSEFGDLLGLLETSGLIHFSASCRSPGKSGKRGLARATSFTFGASGLGSGKSGQEVKLVEGVRPNEVYHGLGINTDGITRKSSDDPMAEEVYAIWEKEKSRIDKETKVRLQKSTSAFELFGDAIED